MLRYMNIACLVKSKVTFGTMVAMVTNTASEFLITMFTWINKSKNLVSYIPCVNNQLYPPTRARSKIYEVESKSKGNF